MSVHGNTKALVILAHSICLWERRGLYKSVLSVGTPKRLDNLSLTSLSVGTNNLQYLRHNLSVYGNAKAEMVLA